MFYPGETVRLLRELAEPALPQYMEGNIVSIVRDAGGAPYAAEVRFYRDSGACTATLPFADMELVVSRTMCDRTAVFWALNGPPEKLVEAAMHSVLDGGFSLREGLNVARLYYDRGDRWWKWGEKMSDPTGALVSASAPAWDGCVVAFSGPQRFHLEFRMQGRGEAVLLLHEQESAYVEQTGSTNAAMSLARVLMNLYATAGALYCAFPAADPWLMDEDWKSLLRAPLYPDFFLLPEAEPPQGISAPFREVRLAEKRVMWTTLPVKAAPSDPPIKRAERDLKLDCLRRTTALGEKYYDQMYESRHGVTGIYSNAKDAFGDATYLANELGMKEEAEALSKRLEHIKAVFRSQFS
ncbi:MAG TPA: hypothetical protein VH724_16260 [Candidatus Angelobacter sp.]|nr:hypothetical protein [Candidatus Angelobacter sp.]